MMLAWGPVIRIKVGCMIVGLMTLACSSVGPSSQPIAEDSLDSAIPTEEQQTYYDLKQTFPMNIGVTTTAITRFGFLDQKHTCEGENISPQISWSGVPDQSKSLGMVFEHLPGPDGNPLIHFFAYNIPPNMTDFSEGTVNLGTLPQGAVIGNNHSTGETYNGPCPPPIMLQHDICPHPGKKGAADPKIYNLKLYALDMVLDVTNVRSWSKVLENMEGHVIDGGEIEIQYRARKRVRAKTCTGG